MNPQEQAKSNIAVLAKNIGNSASRCSKELIPLADDFVPGPKDVICARGKTAFSHPGNRRYRHIIEMNLKKYSTAKTKSEKTFIVSSIIESIRYSSSVGFVQFKHGQWYAVEDSVVREKIGQSFRDLLHNKYRSSNKAKKQRRRDIIKNNVSLARASLSIKTENVSSNLDPLPFVWPHHEILPQSNQGHEKIHMNHILMPNNNPSLDTGNMEPTPIDEGPYSIGDGDSSSTILPEVIESENTLIILVEFEEDSKPMPLSSETLSIGTESDSSSISELSEWISSDEELLHTMDSSLF